MSSMYNKLCIICNYDVTGADLENSPYAFDQSEKRMGVQCIIIRSIYHVLPSINKVYLLTYFTGLGPASGKPVKTTTTDP